MLKNKSAVITGGSRGIGLAIATALAKAGSLVTLIARDVEELKKARATIVPSDKVSIVALDVGDAGAVGKFAGGLSRLDILVNAAAVVTPIGPVESVDPEAWLELLRINVFGTFLMTQACTPLLAQGGNGTIINFVGGGEGAFPNFSAYAASKGAIARFTETIAAELKDKNITVNAIAPGAVNTKMTEDMLAAGVSAGKQYERAQKQKEDTEATPEKAVRLALWLCSEKARGVSGKIISAKWDDYEHFPEHEGELMSSDVYTMRRVQAKDRGFDWGDT